MNFKPKFEHFGSGQPRLASSNNAKKYLEDVRAGRIQNIPSLCEEHTSVRERAKAEVKRLGGNPNDETVLLGQYIAYFGRYRGQTFRWLVENDLGFSAWLVDNMNHSKEQPTNAPLSRNKHAFKAYLMRFVEGRQAIEIKASDRERKDREKRESANKVKSVISSVRSAIANSTISPQALSSRISRGLSSTSTPKPNIPSGSVARSRGQAHSTSTSTASTTVKVLQASHYTSTCTASTQVAQSSVQSQSSSASSALTKVYKDASIGPDTLSNISAQSTSSVQSTASLNAYAPEVIKDTISDTLASSIEWTEPDEALVMDSEADDVSDQVLLQNAADFETQILSSSISKNNPDAFPLIEGWKQSLQKYDQDWISKALFKYSARGKPVLDFSKVKKMWWYPPQPALLSDRTPKVDRYFTRKLFLWMPRKFWQVQLVCPQEECSKHHLTSAGLYTNVREVLDIDGFYYMAAEYLECGRCKRKRISWDSAILEQLDVGHRVQFPVLMTYKYACDIRVIRLLRQRSLGNSSTQLYRKLKEQHGEAWLARVTHYLTDCQAFVQAQNRQLIILQEQFEQPPPQKPVPLPAWLLTVYCNDVLSRLEDVKAAITSTFGRVLKIDSTKKIVKKLSGRGGGTASWCTNVGNEIGQVLISVLTTSEGTGLHAMAAGLVQRYKNANVQAPKLIYTDRDCCFEGGVSTLFPDWKNVTVRLDAWHFMRRIASGCTTDCHPLYGVFMGRLSQCIFEWSSDDLETLKTAKASILAKQFASDPTEVDVLKSITKRELALHCRRKTRGTTKTVELITRLLETFSGNQGRDTMGTALLDHDKIWAIWESQQRHVQCLQDPDDVRLYTEVGRINKGGIALPVLRCARGSTSLESFHLHLNRFIPGTSANDVHFQAYLLEGLMRWNQDRERTAMGSRSSSTYCSRLTCVANNLNEEVFGFKLDQDFKEPRQYTGELIGVEYLYSQTGHSLEKISPYRQASDEEEVDVDDDEIDEGFQEADDLTISLDLTEPASFKQPVQEKMPSTSGLQEEFVDTDNIAGYSHVKDLANYLVKISHCSCLSNSQAQKIIQLWNSLSAHDKSPVVFPPRYRKRLTGRFKTTKTKKPEKPGVVATKRCFLGENSGPASRPDVNRYMEAIAIRLCEIYPSKIVKKGKTTSRWALILERYKKIRDLVLSNATVMRGTKMQLVEINSHTLRQWYNRRSKAQEQEVLMQGITLPTPQMAATDALPPAEKQPSIATPQSDPHVFLFPINTAGHAETRVPIFPRPLNQSTSTSDQTATSDVPASTKSYRKRRNEREVAGRHFRKYTKRVGPAICSRCGEPRTGGHTQYFGNWFCPKTEELPFSEWQRQMKERRKSKNQKE